MSTICRDITTLTAGIVCHQVNAVGVFNAGLAKQIRKKWPAAHEAYRRHTPRLGQIQVIGVEPPGLWVANLCTQQGWGRTGVYTDYVALRTCLQKLDQWLDGDILALPVYIPYRMGCGLGGGDWRIVERIIDDVLPQAIVCKIS